LCEAQIGQPTEESFDFLLGSNLAQMPKLEEDQGGHRVCF